MPKALMKAGLVGLIGAVFLPRTWFIEAHLIWLDVFPFLILAATGALAVIFVGAKVKSAAYAFGYGATAGIIAVIVAPIALSLVIYIIEQSQARREELDIMKWIVATILIPRSLIIGPLVGGLGGVMWRLWSNPYNRVRQRLDAFMPSRTFRVGLIGGVCAFLFLGSALFTGGWIDGGLGDTFFMFLAYSLIAGFPLGILVWEIGFPLAIIAVTGAVSVAVASAEMKSWTNALWRGMQSGIVAVIPLWVAFFLLMAQLSRRLGPGPSLAGEPVAIFAMIGSSFLIAMTIISPVVAGVGGVVWKLTLGRGKGVAEIRQ